MTLKFITLGIVTFATLPLHAADPEIVQLWPDKPPGFQVTGGPEADTSTPDSRPVAGKPVIRLGNVSVPQLHIYSPPDESNTGTAVVICPGGGFNILAWDLEGTEVAEWLNTLGVTAAVLKYRTPTRDADANWEPPVQDAQRAIRWLRSNAEKLKINNEKVGIAGFSAGGKTAAMTAVQGTNSLYEAIDDVDTASPKPNFQILIYPAYLVDDGGQLLDIVQLDKTSPPAFMVHAQDDPVTPLSSAQLFVGLKSVSVPAEVHIFESGGHGYGLRPTDQPITGWPKLCEAWLRQQQLIPKD